MMSHRPFSAERLIAAGMTEDVARKIERSYWAVRGLIEKDVPISVATSFGKDSSVATAIVILAYHDACKAGTITYPLIVKTADTGIENPAIQAYAQLMLQHVQSYAQRHDLLIITGISRPSLAASWQVKTVGGRGIPTFATSATRDCTTDLKIVPMERLTKKLLKTLQDEIDNLAGSATDDRFWRLNALAAGLRTAKHVTVLGTRFDESDDRQKRMVERGDHEGDITVGDDGSLTLPIICSFTEDDVWETLSFCGQSNDKPFYAFAPDFEATIALYRSAAGGECPVVSAARSQKSACGSRFGCSLCAVTGASDRSMEQMIDAPEFRWMAPLNALRNYVVNTQTDWSRRRWSARTTDKVTDHMALEPDAYSPQECAALLGMMLTIDIQEIERADDLGLDLLDFLAGHSVVWKDPHMRATAAAGAPDLAYARRMSQPAFQLIDLPTLLAIDFLWARYNMAKPFHALWIYRQVYRQGMRFPVPALAPIERSRKPSTRWLPLPKIERIGGTHPLFDPIARAMTERPGDDLIEVTPTTIGYQVLEDDLFSVGLEAASVLFEGWHEVDRLLDLYHDGGFAPFAAMDWYLRGGIIQIRKGGMSELERVADHCQRLARAGINPGDNTAEMLAVSISDAEHTSLRATLIQKAKYSGARGLPASPAGSTVCGSRTRTRGPSCRNTQVPRDLFGTAA